MVVFCLSELFSCFVDGVCFGGKNVDDGGRIENKSRKDILSKKVSLRRNPLTINNLRQIHTMEKIIVDTLRNIPASWGRREGYTLITPPESARSGEIRLKGKKANP
jgi:predicted Zn-ribbon and HTH transcriptional regulator